MAVYTKEVFEEWKLNSVTRRFLKKLDYEREVLKEMLATHSDCDVANLRGRAAAIASITDISYEDLENE